MSRKGRFICPVPGCDYNVRLDGRLSTIRRDEHIAAHRQRDEHATTGLRGEPDGDDTAGTPDHNRRV